MSGEWAIWLVINSLVNIPIATIKSPIITYMSTYSKRGPNCGHTLKSETRWLVGQPSEVNGDCVDFDKMTLIQKGSFTRKKSHENPVQVTVLVRWVSPCEWRVTLTVTSEKKSLIWRCHTERWGQISLNKSHSKKKHSLLEISGFVIHIQILKYEFWYNLRTNPLKNIFPTN
jgi:hypothetical protein